MKYFFYALFRFIFGSDSFTVLLWVLGILLVLCFLGYLIFGGLGEDDKADVKVDVTKLSQIDQWFYALVEQIYGYGKPKRVKWSPKESHYAELRILKNEELLRVTIDELSSNRTIDGKTITPDVLSKLNEDLHNMMDVRHRGSMPELVIENDRAKIIFGIPKVLVDSGVLKEEMSMLRGFVNKNFEPAYGKQFSYEWKDSGKQQRNPGYGDRNYSREQLVDLYAMLEITPDVPNAIVKQAYRRMAKLYHPDLHNNLEDGIMEGMKARFREINRAYETIKQIRKMK